MSQSGPSSDSDCSDEYSHRPILSAAEKHRAGSATPQQQQTPSPAKLPWEQQHQESQDSQVDEVLRKFESKLGGRRSSGKNFRAACQQGAKNHVREIRKQNRSSGQSSMLTSPESNHPENPFTFQSHAHHTPGTASSGNLAHVGSKPIVPPHHATRNRKTKKRNKDRSYDRDLKLLGADHDRGHAVAVPDNGGFKPAYEVETSNRFLSLASRPVEKFEVDEPKDQDRDFRLRRQSLSRSASRWPNCPKERVKFFEYFSVLIELGSKAKRKKEDHMRRTVANPTPDAWRNELHDVLWLELQGWMRNATMDVQDHYLMTEREKIDDILAHILAFRIDEAPSGGGGCYPCNSDGFAEIDMEYLSSLHSAYKQVSRVLQQLDLLEHLYPCTKKIGLSHALYDRAQFQDKVKALIMWSNFYIQLSYRLQAVAGIISGRKCNEIFPQLHTQVSQEFNDRFEGLDVDVVDGVGAVTLEVDSARSGFSSRQSSLHDLTQMDEEELDQTHHTGTAIQAAVRTYLEKSMRKRGLEKTITQIKNLIFPTLRHIIENLSQPVASAHLNRQCSSPDGRFDVDIVKLWADLHRDANLPCLDRVFAYMLRLPIQTLREGITLRLEQRPENDPDLASLNQLIHECKDTLILAIKIKADYIEMGLSIQHHEVMLADIKILDELMKKLLELYLEYLQQWILMLQKESKASRTQKTILEDEWKTMMMLCGGIDDAELEMPKVFCAIVQGLLTGIGSLLDSGLDDFISSLYHGEDGMNAVAINGHNSPSMRDMLRQFFRDCKSVFVEAKERCFKLLEFTKLLHKDLEIAAVYEVNVSWDSFLGMLADSNHYEVEVAATTEKDSKFRFFVSAISAGNSSGISFLLNATMGGRDQDAEWDGYLLIVPANPHKWTGRTFKIDAGAVTAIRHSHVELEVGHVMVVVLKNSLLAMQAKQFEKRLPKDAVKVFNGQTTCHQVISQDLEAIKEESLELGKKVCAVILRVQDEIGVDQFPDIDQNDRNMLIKSSRELLIQSYNFCIEYHRELARLAFDDEHALAQQLFFLARQWMEFVVTKCERGHGVRTRWSTPGLDYLTVAVRPNYTRYLTEDEFQAFKTQIDACVTHVIGDQPPPGMKTPAESPNTPFYLSPPQSTLQFHRSSLSFTDGYHLGIPSRLSSKSDTNTTFSTESSDEGEESDSYEPRHRVEEATAKLELKLAQKQMERKAVGRVVPTESMKNLNHLKARKVDFKWRLCGKLGSGRHADVFKVMNLDTGGLLAAKKFQVSQATFTDRINKLATEIEWLAGLKHQNVVQYFGVEIHRDELVLFMEYCDGGTLSDVARQGLDIMMVRVYTKQLLLGVAYLHENGICHLDIKGQNVFLTSAGQIKIGDFSEMVKLGETNSTGTNEIREQTGTPRYMSPEMIRGGEGSKIGRATDIWSLGCVVVEMVTGKTPKFDREDNDYAIMFHVGGGGRPKIPDNLNTDCRDFLDHCFEKEADARWKADKLLNHAFVTVNIGDIEI
ncbi:Mitogen-activated protein kinase kinase kinase 4 [Hypsibius exemplaris]|uniref:Mitogen-activated protein kinase kinase kinase 4 n=1 Tax=Hypsibius exemplaris TaxID=2072580 RepID=A0A1W0WNF8_HYPEX|nr:Mitogen-activated protein kinase kinase kinase 4 [Hypsibius exemplaris]